MSGVVTVEIGGVRYPIRSGLDPAYVAEEHGTFDEIAAVDAPRETTILGAAKVTGKVGDGWKNCFYTHYNAAVVV